MFILTFEKFNEKIVFSLLKNSKSFKGKIVCINTHIKSSDGYNLHHVYLIVDDAGKIGKFLGNIKYRNEIRFFRKSSGRPIIENIVDWFDITKSDRNLMLDNN